MTSYEDLLRQQAYVDGQWLDAASGKTLDVTDPATGDVIGTVPDMGADETVRAIAAAEKALPGWAKTTAGERARILRRFFDLMIANQDALGELLSREQGKPFAEAKGEIAYAAGFIEWFAEEGKRAYGEVIPAHAADRRIVTIRQPIGVVANVAGIVTGGGRIDWSGRGVTSGGTFETDGLDLAAAFGPVTGIRTRIMFTDLLGLVSAPHQEARIAEVNPGIAVSEGVVHYQLTGGNRLRVEDAAWPFAGGALRLDPATLDFGGGFDRRLTFRIEALDAAAFVQQLDFPNIAATGTFDGSLPMIFDSAGGRIEHGGIVARAGGGTLAYVGELSQASLGTIGKLAFDALKAIRYSSLSIGLDGRLDGEMVSRVRFTGVRQATVDPGLVARLIRNLPFRFNIEIRAPFRGLVGSARSYQDPRLLLDQARATPAAVQPPASADRR